MIQRFLKHILAAKEFLKDKRIAPQSGAILLCFFNEFVGTFGATDFYLSAAAGNPYFLATGRAFKMLIGFSFLKIRADSDPFIFKFIPKVHELLVFDSSLNNVFRKGSVNRNSVKDKRNQI